MPRDSVDDTIDLIVFLTGLLTIPVGCGWLVGHRWHDAIVGTVAGGLVFISMLFLLALRAKR